MPKGSFSLAAEKLRRMLALGPTFCAAIGAATMDEAETKIFLKSAVGDTPRPYAVISPGLTHIRSKIATGPTADNVGSLFLYLTLDTSRAFFEDLVAADFEAADFVGGIIDDLWALPEDDPNSPFDESHLEITRTELQAFGCNPEDTWQSIGRFYTAVYHVEYGTPGGA